MKKEKGNDAFEEEQVQIMLKSGKIQLPEGYEFPKQQVHHDSFTSVRELIYRGKTIRVETTYKITIGEESLRTHTFVLDDGRVCSHEFPNYSFPSALDLARRIIDTSDFEIPKNELIEQNTSHKGGQN